MAWLLGGKKTGQMFGEFKCTLQALRFRTMEAELRDYFETMKLLISTLGYPIFDKITKPKKRQIIYCVGKSAYATGEYTEDG